jgi:hypothetical protein
MIWVIPAVKNLLIIFLVSVLTFPFWGTYSFFHFERNKIRKEVDKKIEAGIDKTQLLVLAFTLEETRTLLTWKHSREFVYQGQMYDIVEQTSAEDSVFYTCYLDDKETRLGLNKEKLIAKALGQDPTRKSQSDKLTNFLKTVFSQDVFAWNPFPPQASDIHFSFFVFHFSFFTQAPPSPPPEGENYLLHL